MRAVNHNGELLALLDEGLLSGLDVGLVVVGALGTTTEDDEAVLVAGGAGDGGQTLLGDTHEVVLGSGGADSVNGNVQAAVGTVLETDGERETGGQLTVELGLGGAGTDSADGDEVSEELGRDGVEHLGGDGHAGRGEIAEELSRDTETLVNLEGLVDIGVVNQTLPADSRPRLLEVGAHDDDKVILELLGESLEPVAVLNRSGGIVNRTGANDDQETVVATHNDVDSIPSTLDNGLKSRVGHGNLRNEEGRRNEGVLAQHFKQQVWLAIIFGFLGQWCLEMLVVTEQSCCKGRQA